MWDIVAWLAGWQKVAPAVLLALAVAGLVAWALGRQLARPVCCVLGAATGAAVALLLAPHWPTVPPAWAALGGGMAGLAAALGLFRLWMGLSTALVAAAAAAVAVLVWQGGAAPPPPPVIPVLLEANRAAKGSATELPQRALNLGDIQFATLAQWWHDMPPTYRHTAVGIATTCAMLGLALGLIRPLLAASVQSALLGAALLLLAGTALLRLYLPQHARLLPEDPRHLLAVLGLITLVGVVVQWTFARRTADKGSG